MEKAIGVYGRISCILKNMTYKKDHEILFGQSGKLSPRYIVEPYEILEQVNQVAYRLALMTDLDKVHSAFYVPMLYKYIMHLSHILRHESS